MKKLPPIVWALLVPPWVLFLLGVYWYFLDTQPPLEIVYSHPLFTSAPVTNRDDAKAKEITQALGGASVYTYREFCRLRSLPGKMITRWDAKGFSWTVPAEEFPALPLGCTTASYEVTLPTSNPTRAVRYVSERHYRINWLRDAIIAAPDIPITILANK
jgi:hypothetical protein